MNKILLAILLLTVTTAEAAFQIRNGSLVDAEVAPTMSLAEHFDAGVAAYNQSNWYEAVKHFRVVSDNAPHAPLGQESHFWLGVSQYKVEDFDFANLALTKYLQTGTNPAYFQEAIEYKYMIAEQFRLGAKRYPFGTKQLPKWASGMDLAPQIYDEVIAAMPSGEMAARAMYAKGWMLWEQKDFRGSIDAFQGVIKRFPKHELTPDSYVMLTIVYLNQARFEFQNPDILAFAEMTLRKFAADFPREERLAKAEQNVMSIKELYANGLYETGQFYERTSQPKASLIYYQNAVSQFPDTKVADKCRKRLEALS